MSYLFKLIQVYRPALLLAPGLIFGLSFFLSEASFSWTAFLQLLCITFLAPILVFGVNNVFDFESDKNNPRKKQIWFGETLQKEDHKFIIKAAIVVSFALILSSLFTLNLINLILMVFGISIAWLYSTPPFRLKDKAFGDVFSNIFGLLSIAGLGLSFGNLEIFLSSVPLERIIGICLALFMASLLAGLADYEADLEAGTSTTAIFFGKQISAIFGLLAILPLLLINFQEAPFLKSNLYLICLIYLPVILLPSNKKIVTVTYNSIAIITIISFIVYIRTLV